MMGWRFRTMAAATVAAALCMTTVARAQYGYEESAPAPEAAPLEAAQDTAGGGDTWTEIGWGALTVASNLAYMPAKLVYAGLGGLTGGLAYGLTGGDSATAQQIWEPSLGGDYFLTPGMIKGEDNVSFAGAPAELTAPAPKPEEAPPATGYEAPPSSGYDAPPDEYGSGDTDDGR